MPIVPDDTMEMWRKVIEKREKEMEKIMKEIEMIMCKEQNKKC